MRRSSFAALATVSALAVAPTLAHAQGVDILRQDLLVDIATADATTATIDLELLATASTTGFSTVNFAMPVSQVMVNEVIATAVPNPSYPEYLTDIVFPSTFGPGDAISVTIELSGTPTCRTSGQACKRSPEETIFTFATPGAAWYHANPFEPDPFLGSVAMRVQSGFLAAAGNGTLREITPDGEGTERWIFDFLAPTEIFGGYAASSANVSKLESVAGFPVSAIFPTGIENSSEVERAADVASRVLPVLMKHYGALPISRASLVTVPKTFAFGAMSTLGIVFVNEVVFTTDTYLVEQGMAHETSHFWWGNLASAEEPREGPFFGESMAEYSGWRALGELDGPQKRTAGMRMNANWYMYRRPGDVDMAVLTGDQDSPAFVYSVYHKGPVVLRTLAEYVGEAEFGEALKRALALGHGGLSIEKLADDVAKETGVDLNPLIDQWLRKKGFPSISVSTMREADGTTLTFDVEGAYTLRVPVVLTFEGGEVTTEWIDIEEGSSSITFPEKTALLGIELDPEWTMVREIMPERREDVTFDGDVDGADLVATALRVGTFLPDKRRVDGGYDPLFDIDEDREVGDADLEQIIDAASR